MNGKKGKAVFMIILGIAIAAIPFIIRQREQDRANQYVKEFKEDEDESEETANRKKKDALLLQKGVIGIIEIPSLKLKYPIFEGAGAEQLNEGIGHMENTAKLCGTGNCVLAGHNGSRRGIYFTNLCSIEAGAKVKITNKDRELHEYTVAEMRVVNPYDEWVTEESEEEMLTLFTCSGHGTRRFVCKCVPVKDYSLKGGGATDEQV
jgi:LPXTG-site transpeptidase (sortase) family protein